MLPHKQVFGKRVGWITVVIFIIFFTGIMVSFSSRRVALSWLPTRTPTISAPPHLYLPFVVSEDGPTLTLVPNCAQSGPTVTLTLVGINWPTNEGIDWFWNDTLQAKTLSGHDGALVQTWTESGIVTGTQEDPTVYEVRAVSDSYTVSASFSVPCAAGTPPPPDEPFISLIPDCTNASEAQFAVAGFNWPNDESIVLFWDGSPQSVIPAEHGGAFIQSWTKSGLTVGTANDPAIYEVRALSNSHDTIAPFAAPCGAVTPTPTVTATSTVMPTAPATATTTPTMTPDIDLAILGTPVIMSTPPIIAYQPIDVALVVRNLGAPINSTFFLDVFFDPAGPITETIPISQSVGYTAVTNMESGETRIVQIHVPQGFANWPDPHLAYSVADSLEQITELDETNNVSPPSVLTYVTPAATPTPTATPIPGTEEISGVVYRREILWQPQPRVFVTLVDEWTGTAVQSTQSDMNGYFQFSNVPEGNYTIHACANIDNMSYFGIRIGIPAPNAISDIYLLPGPCG